MLCDSVREFHACKFAVRGSDDIDKNLVCPYAAAQDKRPKKPFMRLLVVMRIALLPAEFQGQTDDAVKILRNYLAAVYRQY